MIDHNNNNNNTSSSPLTTNMQKPPMRITPSPSEEDLPSLFQRASRRKSVVFAETTRIIPIASPLQPFYDNNSNNNNTIDASWKADIWYQVDELTQFRNQARDVCRGMRLLAQQQQHKSSTTTTTPRLTICSDDDSDDDDDNNSNYYCTRTTATTTTTAATTTTTTTRGLEQRSCLERQRRKYMATRFIVKAARSAALDDQQLAALAQKCNAWACRLAREEGARDYGRAYKNNNNKKKKKKQKNGSTTTAATATVSVLESSSSTPHKRLSSEREDLEMAARLVRARVC